MRALAPFAASAAARQGVLAVAALVLVVTAALTGSGLAGTALRAISVLGALALAAAWLRRRQVVRPDATLSVDAREPLSRDTGVALIRVEARRLLVGYGPTGVVLVAELERTVAPP
jgi:flagellar protein FliO/FliZ